MTEIPQGNSFFEWLEKYSPGFTKEIFNNYEKALNGTMRNPFQWKATEYALNTEFSKATQKHEHAGGVTVHIVNYTDTPQLPATTLPVGVPQVPSQIQDSSVPQTSGQVEDGSQRADQESPTQ